MGIYGSLVSFKRSVDMESRAITWPNLAINYLNDHAYTLIQFLLPLGPYHPTSLCVH